MELPQFSVCNGSTVYSVPVISGAAEEDQGSARGPEEPNPAAQTGPGGQVLSVYLSD